MPRTSYVIEESEFDAYNLIRSVGIGQASTVPKKSTSRERQASDAPLCTHFPYLQNQLST